jgi:hypothetical protein
LRPFAVAIALPRNLLCLNVIRTYSYTHARNLTISAQNRKTYGRLLGMIFLEGAGSLVDSALQRLATKQNQENHENTKKSVIFFRADGPFSAKTA